MGGCVTTSSSASVVERHPPQYDTLMNLELDLENIENWSVEQVGVWIQSIENIRHYQPTFEEQKINGTLLLQLDVTILENGPYFMRPKQIEKLLQWIERLRMNQEQGGDFVPTKIVFNTRPLGFSIQMDQEIAFVSSVEKEAILKGVENGMYLTQINNKKFNEYSINQDIHEILDTAALPFSLTFYEDMPAEVMLDRMHSEKERHENRPKLVTSQNDFVKKYGRKSILNIETDMRRELQRLSQNLDQFSTIKALRKPLVLMIANSSYMDPEKKWFSLTAPNQSCEIVQSVFTYCGFEIFNNIVHRNLTKSQMENIFDDLNNILENDERYVFFWYCGHAVVNTKEGYCQSLISIDGQSVDITTKFFRKSNLKNQNKIIICDFWGMKRQETLIKPGNLYNNFFQVFHKNVGLASINIPTKLTVKLYEQCGLLHRDYSSSVEQLLTATIEALKEGTIKRQGKYFDLTLKPTDIERFQNKTWEEKWQQKLNDVYKIERNDGIETAREYLGQIIIEKEKKNSEIASALWYAYGKYNLYCHLPEHARLCFEKVIEIDPQHVESLHTLAQLLHSLFHEISIARELYQTILEIDVSRSNVYLHLAQLEWDESQNLELVENYLSESVKLSPQSWESNFYWGRLNEENGNYQLSLKHYHIALNLNRSDVQIYYYLANLYAHHLNDPTSAHLYFFKVIDKCSSPAFLYQAGRFFEKLHPKTALLAFSRCRGYLNSDKKISKLKI